MKTRTFMTLFIAAYVVLATACVPSEQITDENGRTVAFPYGASVWTDKDTGCDYIVINGERKTAITPRLNPDGTQRCAQP